jgi:hypothetical protein
VTTARRVLILLFVAAIDAVMWTVLRLITVAWA